MNQITYIPHRVSAGVSGQAGRGVWTSSPTLSHRCSEASVHRVSEHPHTYSSIRIAKRTTSLWIILLPSRYLIAEQIWVAMSRRISLFNCFECCCRKLYRDPVQNISRIQYHHSRCRASTDTNQPLVSSSVTMNVGPSWVDTPWSFSKFSWWQSLHIIKVLTETPCEWYI